MERKSFYGLSALGQLRKVNTQRHIYDFTPLPWDGHWTLALVDAHLKSSTRQHFKRELLWAGFGRLSGNVFAHPRADHGALKDIIHSTQTQNQLVVMTAQGLYGYAAQPLATVMQETFKLSAVAEAWQAFIRRFALARSEAASLPFASAFFTRTLLIHEYRKLLLRGPQLPAPLLPADWPGCKARALCEALYISLAVSGMVFMAEQVSTLQAYQLGALPSSWRSAMFLGAACARYMWAMGILDA